MLQGQLCTNTSTTACAPLTQCICDWCKHVQAQCVQLEHTTCSEQVGVYLMTGAEREQTSHDEGVHGTSLCWPGHVWSILHLCTDRHTWTHARTHTRMHTHTRTITVMHQLIAQPYPLLQHKHTNRSVILLAPTAVSTATKMQVYSSSTDLSWRQNVPKLDLNTRRVDHLRD